MATTQDDIIKALYRHLAVCTTCNPRGVPLPNEYKCSEGKRLAQVFTIR